MGDCTASTSSVSSAIDDTARDREGKTELHIAAGFRGDHPNGVRDGIASGIMVDAKDDHGHTALHLAACAGHVECVKELLAEGASVAERSSRHFTPLHYAAEKGSVDTVRILLDSGADIEASAEPSFADGEYGGPTALHIASGCGHVDLMRELVVRGADVDKSSLQGTPVFFALNSERSTEALEILIDAGADTQKRTPFYEESLLHVAAEGDFQEGTFEMLTNKAGLDVNMVDCLDRTPLVMACAMLNERAIAKLLRLGADEGVFVECLPSNDESMEHARMTFHLEGVLGSGVEMEKNPGEPEASKSIANRLARAPADRTWYRRGWLVMLRQRYLRRDRSFPREPKGSFNGHFDDTQDAACAKPCGAGFTRHPASGVGHVSVEHERRSCAPRCHHDRTVDGTVEGVGPGVGTGPSEPDAGKRGIRSSSCDGTKRQLEVGNHPHASGVGPEMVPEDDEPLRRIVLALVSEALVDDDMFRNVVGLL